MGANDLGEILTAPRAHVRAAPVQDVCGELVVVVTDVADRAPGDGVLRAVEEDERTLLGSQDVRSLTVDMRQTTTGRLDDVCKRDWLRALRAVHLRIHLHVVMRQAGRQRRNWTFALCGTSPRSMGVSATIGFSPVRLRTLVPARVIELDITEIWNVGCAQAGHREARGKR